MLSEFGNKIYYILYNSKFNVFLPVTQILKLKATEEKVYLSL